MDEKYKIIVTSMGSWISGFDDSLVQDFINIGAPGELFQYYQDFLNDQTKMDISIAFIGEKSIKLEEKILGQIERNSHLDYEDFTNLNKTKIHYVTTLQTSEKCQGNLNVNHEKRFCFLIFS